MEKNFKLIINRRNLLNKELDETYINMIDNINNKVKELENIDKVLQKIFLKLVLWILLEKLLEIFLIWVIII